ncbi:Uncharacterized protein dnm_032590 [Desulfonema magnum]|uniref:Uncharacterized protein n=1 Tax=Desulfonema magnum TaxID=45655 RepID=A0A975BK77_9BACT|nr:Uncharacterized protein dnm_032590 [Desulfonema magnum]
MHSGSVRNRPSYPECEKCFFAGERKKLFLRSAKKAYSPECEKCLFSGVRKKLILRSAKNAYSPECEKSLFSGVRKMLFRKCKNKIFALRIR